MTIETFVPLMEKGKGFEELKRLVIDSGLCSHCGSCLAFCDRLIMSKEGPVLKEGKNCELEKGAIRCSLCYSICPNISFSITDLEKKVFGDIKCDPELGCYKKIVKARSTSKDILNKAQDGGAVTSLLTFALEKKYIDGAIVAGRTQDWAPTQILAKTREDLLRSTGSKYSRNELMPKFGEALREKNRKLALVGLGCHITGARKLEELKLAATGVDLILIGLFCYESFPHDCLKEELESKLGVSMSDVAKVRIEKGKVSVWTKDGTPHQMRIKELHRCMVDPCLLCSNLTCMFSDISCGSLGSEEGWTTLIVRTEKGMKLLDEAVKESYLELSDEVDLDGVRRTVSSKNKKREALVQERTEKGLYVPVFE